jgi:hypothetical protein
MTGGGFTPPCPTDLSGVIGAKRSDTLIPVGILEIHSGYGETTKINALVGIFVVPVRLRLEPVIFFRYGNFKPGSFAWFAVFYD